jgi:hypothetical protein
VLVPADDMVAEEDVVADEGRCRITCRMSSSAWRPDESRLADPLRRLRTVVSAVHRAHKVRVALAPKPEPMFRKASRDQKRKWAWRALLARTVAELDALRRDPKCQLTLDETESLWRELSQLQLPTWGQGAGGLRKTYEGKRICHRGLFLVLVLRFVDYHAFPLEGPWRESLVRGNSNRDGDEDLPGFG